MRSSHRHAVAEEADLGSICTLSPHLLTGQSSISIREIRGPFVFFKALNLLKLFSLGNKVRRWPDLDGRPNVNLLCFEIKITKKFPLIFHLASYVTSHVTSQKKFPSYSMSLFECQSNSAAADDRLDLCRLVFW